MNENEDEKIMTSYIPDNVDDGVDLWILTVPMKDLAISAIFIGPIAILIVYLLYKTLGSSSLGKSLIIIVALLGVVMIVAMAKGLNDEPFTELFKHMLDFKKVKRICIYNPRIKDEIIPLNALSEDFLAKNITPRDKAQEWWRKFSEERTSANFSVPTYSASDIEFEDDIEYKKSIEEEKKNEAKEQKNAERNRRKKQKQKKKKK